MMIPRTRLQAGRVVLVCLMIAFIAGCAKPTFYAPNYGDGRGNGYADLPLEQDRYRIVFGGNSVTSRETVETYALYRAAEVTVDAGHDYFVVVDKSTEIETGYRTAGTGTGGFGYSYYGRRRSGIGGGFFTARSRPISSYQAIVEIIVGSGDKPDDISAYNARNVLETLGPSIVRAETPGG